MSAYFEALFGDHPGTPRRRAAAMACIALVVGLTCYGSIELTRRSGRLACVWFANGLLLALVLKSPKRLWLRWLLAGLGGNLVADMASGDSFLLAVPMSLANTLEISVAAGLFRWLEGEEVDLTRPRSLIRFMLLCGGVAPLLAALVAAVTLKLAQGADPLGVLVTWTVADSLGFMIVVPLLTSTQPADFTSHLKGSRALEAGAYVILVSGLTAAFVLSREPFWLFALYPLFVAGSVRKGFAGAAATVALATVTGLAFLFLAASRVDMAGHIREQMIELQGLILSCVLTALPVSALVTEVRSSESRFRSFFRQHYLPMWYLRAEDGLILEANPAAMAYYGFGPGLEGMHVWEINTSGPEGYAAVLQETCDSGRGQWTMQHRRADGELRRIQVFTVLLADQDQLLSVHLDVTDRMRAEEELRRERARYESIMDISQEAIHLIDLEGRLVEANPAFLAALGYTAREAGGLQVKDWDALIPPQDLPDRIQQYLKTPGRFETRHRRKDGTLIDVEIQAGKLELDGKPYLLCSARNISQRKEAERRLQELLDNLEERVRQEVARNLESERVLLQQSRLAAMGEMISAIAHQWRQPLNALGLTLENLKDAQRYGELTEESMEGSLGKARQLIQKMSTTINDFRDFYRPDRQAERFSVAAEVGKTLSLVESSFHYHNIALDLQVLEDMWLEGFPQDFSQVLLSLLQNARQAIQERAMQAGRVEVLVDRQADHGRVRVRDNGGGIEDSARERLFEPYFTTRPEGTGLGLYLSRTIVERKLQGQISCQNVPGGAEFSLLLPMLQKA